MAGKTLRRKVVIREKDFNELNKNARSAGYTSVEWHPLSIDQLSKELIVQFLGDTAKTEPFLMTRERKFSEHYFGDIEYYARCAINNLVTCGKIYNPHYKEWRWNFDIHNDQILIRPRCNLPWSSLGLAVLGMEY